MNWYIIKLVYRIINGSSRPQFDEQLRLMRADEWNWAVEKAHTLGRLGEIIFFDHEHQQVQWKFVGVAEILPVDEIEDGVLLMSETSEPDELPLYMELVSRRNARWSASAYEHKTVVDMLNA